MVRISGRHWGVMVCLCVALSRSAVFQLATLYLRFSGNFCHLYSDVVGDMSRETVGCFPNGGAVS